MVWIFFFYFHHFLRLSSTDTEGKNADVGEKSVVVTFPSTEHKTSCSYVRDHSKDTVPSSACPSQMEAHHPQRFCQECISWKPLPSFSSYARFCSMMMMKSLPLQKCHCNFLPEALVPVVMSNLRGSSHELQLQNRTQEWASLPSHTWWWVKERTSGTDNASSHLPSPKRQQLAQSHATEPGNQSRTSNMFSVPLLEKLWQNAGC